MMRNPRYFVCSLTTIALTGLLVSSAVAQAPNTGGVLDPKQADADFAYQGEYSGDISLEGVKTKVGVHVIANGNGKFTARGYIGGLPGDGWTGAEFPKSEGELKDGSVVFMSEADVKLKDGVIVIRDGGGGTIGEFKKVERKSPTLGEKPPAGAVVLFDGKSAENFVNGKLDGDLLVQGVISKQLFQDFTLHLEFMLSYMPNARGQGRANSGCYCQGRYEVQILDSFGLDGMNNECGGIYEVKQPSVNMCFPPLAWQTYDIDFTAAKFDAEGKKTADARLTVKHNGVQIHKDVPVPKSTRAAPVQEGPTPGPIYLQDHKNPVRYRNIWVVEKK